MRTINRLAHSMWHTAILWAVIVVLHSVNPCHDQLRFLGREKFVASPAEDVRVNAFSYYTACDGYCVSPFLIRQR